MCSTVRFECWDTKKIVNGNLCFAKRVGEKEETERNFGWLARLRVGPEAVLPDRMSVGAEWKLGQRE